MKVKTITRNMEECTRERKGDIHKLKRNYDPSTHPFERAREYTRSLQAAKLDRLFAKPFLGAMEGHIDGIYCMNRHSSDIKCFGSGSGDGELRVWDLSSRKMAWNKKNAHDAFIRSICFLPVEGEKRLLSCGDDKFIKLWDYGQSTRTAPDEKQPIALFQGKETFTGIDSHRDGTMFATSGSESVSIWDSTRNTPIHSFTWGTDTHNALKFNQASPNLLASVASDRSLTLHDQRTAQSPLKIIMKMRANALSWNPQEGLYLTLASEDHNLYTFDMRYSDKAVNVMTGHVGAVIDCDYSPCGQEIVSAGYDRTLRLYDNGQGRSRDIYYGRRMQRLFCCKYSLDSHYVMSGSDDGNLRIWKSHASAPQGIKSHRQREALLYKQKALERFGSMPDVKRISQHRRIPKDIKVRTRIEHDHRQSQNRKTANRIKHSRPGSQTKSSIREDVIVQVKK